MKKITVHCILIISKRKNSLFFSIFLGGLLLFNTQAKAQCSNGTQNPAATQVVPTDGTKLSVPYNLALLTHPYIAATVLSGKSYFIYSTTSNYLTAWGTSYGTGLLGSGSTTLFPSPTTGTNMWVDVAASSGCGGLPILSNQTVSIECLPYNITLPSSAFCSNTITITGNALSYVTQVTFTGPSTATATAFNVTPTSFQVVVPSNAQSGPLTHLQTNDGTYIITLNQPQIPSNSITLQTGNVTSYAPTSGGIGDVVTIYGYNLSGATNVQVNGTAATGVTATSNYITFTVAAGTTTGNITFTDGCGNAITVGVFTIVPITNYYLLSAASPTATASWGTNTNGSGTHPGNFTANGQRFYIQNNAAVTIASAWTVSGTGSGIIVGDGTSATNFTVPSGFAFTGSVYNVAATSTLTLQNNSIPTLLASSTTGTIMFNNAATSTIPAINYGNLTINGTGSSKTYTFGGGCTVAGTFSVNPTNSNNTVKLNNTASSAIFYLNNIVIANATLNCASSTGITDINLSGNFTGTGGSITSAAVYNFYVNGGASQTYSNTGATFQNEIFEIQNNTTLTLSTNFVMDGLSGGWTQLIVDAGSTLTCGTNQISTTGTTIVMAVDGTLQTAVTAGLNGSAATTLINTNSPVIVLGAASTIEYNSSSAQTVTARTDYANVTVTNNSTKTPTGACTLSGSLTINSTATFDGVTYIHNIGGNFSNSGTFTGSTSTVNFNGSAGQSITGSSTTTFYNLAIASNSAAGVTLAKPANVSNALTLTSGLLNTDSTNILTMQNGSTAPALTDASTSYVNGFMKYQKSTSGASVLNFPIGTSPDCRPFTLTVNHSNTTLYNYTAQLHNAAASFLGYALPATVDTVSGVHYWNIYRTDNAGTSQPSAGLSGNQIIQLFFGTNDYVYEGSELTIVKNTNAASTTWFDIGGTAKNSSGGAWTNTGAPQAGSVTSTSSPSTFTSFSTFSLGSLLSGWNSLPIELLNFSAVPDNNKVDLNWTTQSEVNNKYFTVERSADGKTFKEVTRKNSKAPNGNSTVKLDYQVTDNNPLPGTSYYRLKQTDNNGKNKTFNVISVNFESKGIKFTVYPNPNQGQFTIDFSGIENNHEVEIILNDEHGKLVYTNSFFTNETTNSVSIVPETRIGKGTYFCSLIAEGIKSTVKVIVN